MGADVERSELKDGSIYTGLEGLLKMLRGVGNESINEISYSIHVSDSKRAIHFYRDILGLPIRAEHGTYVEFETGSTILALNTRESARDITALDIPDTSASNTFEIGFVTENVEAVIKRMREQGVSIIGEPKVKPWGQTVAYIADPDGHYIEICSPME